MNDVDELLRASVILPDRRPIYDWAADTIDFGQTQAFKGKYDVRNVPWTKPFLDAVGNPYVRKVTFIGPPQESGKTVAAEVALAHRICTSPAKAAFNTTTNVKAEKWSETRWENLIKSCPPIKARFSENRHKKKKARVIFADGTFLLIQGAETEDNRTSDSVEFQVNDEGYLWLRPWMKQMHSRTGSYRKTRKIVNISVGGDKGSELEEHFLEGNQLEWCHHCPKCRKPFAYVFDRERPECNIRFDLTKAVLHLDGRLDLREFAKTIYVDCPDKDCGHAMQYDADRLERMNAEGVAIAKNPDANPEIVSLHVNSFAIGRRPWEEILEPWVRLHIRGGVFASEVLKEFVQEALAEFYIDKPTVARVDLKLGDFTLAEVRTRGAWKDELFRVLTMDNQRGKGGDIPHRIFACVAFARDGRVRIVDAGRRNEWEDLKALQRELGIPDPNAAEPGPWVGVDRRYKPVDVDENCANFMWHGFMGMDRDEFIHPEWSPFAGTRQLFSEPRAIDVGFGTAEQGRKVAWYYLWSSQKIQDLLAELRAKDRIGIPNDIVSVFPDFGTQYNSHRQIIERTKKGAERRVWVRIGDTPDHVYDCICQALVIGCMAGIYRREDKPQTAPNNPNPPKS